MKIKIAALSTISAAAGYILARKGKSLSPETLFLLLIGTLFLAAGAAALNQYQEREIDARMERTKRRPIPSGEITPGAGLAAALALIAAGSVTLLSMDGKAPFLLGVFAVAWYNGVYTYLKRVTPLAVIFGALVGAIPPAMGWTAGGGAITSPKILLVCIFFFLWQIPHFWLIMLKYGEEYREAGLPSFSDTMEKEQLKRITFVWFVAVAVASFTIPLFGVTATGGTKLILAGGAILYLLKGISLLKRELEPALPSLFRTVNGYALLLTILIGIDALI